MSGNKEENLIWIDLEMTGLYPEEDKILEAATIITDSQLHIIAEGPVIAIHQEDSLLENMDEWNTRQHNKSGLVERVRDSSLDEAQAEILMLRFLNQYAVHGKSPMCGNSVWQDRRFLARYMPKLERYFHYRMLDVSTLKILAMRWAPSIMKDMKKESSHLALNDIRDSINELKYYRKNLFNTECQV